MMHALFDTVAAIFPLLFLMVFGFVALIWSALLMIMFINTVRVLRARGEEESSSDDDNDDDDDENETLPPPPDRPRPQHRKRNHVHAPASARPGVAAQQSLPPYISQN